MQVEGRVANGSAAAAAGKRRRRSRKGPRCEDCYFRCHGLCALEHGPCSTFRPNRPEGLVPPRQPELLLREPATPSA